MDSRSPSRTRHATGYGFYIHGASNVVVENNYIHDLCHDRVMLDPTDSNIQVLNNKIVHAQMSGINIDGTGDHGRRQRDLGNLSVSCGVGWNLRSMHQDRGSDADADAIRFFGSNHIIRANYLHDIEYDFSNTALPNPSPHIDCFQTWGESGESTSNILIDRNWCCMARERQPGNSRRGIVDRSARWPGGQHHLPEQRFPGHDSRALTRPRMAARSSANSTSTTTPSTTSRRKRSSSTAARAMTTSKTTSSMTSSAATDSSPMRAARTSWITSSTLAPGAPGGRYWGGGATPPFMAVNPLFVSNGDATGVGANYHLCVAGQNGCIATSTIGHAGATISSVPNDFDGNPRAAHTLSARSRCRPDDTWRGRPRVLATTHRTKGRAQCSALAFSH